MSRRLLSTAGAGAVSAALLIASPIGAAAASSNEPAIVVNRETVQAELNPSGSVDTARLFSQLVVTGDGTYKVFDPTSGKNIRDLDGFSAPRTDGANAVWDVDVHGRATRRTVADYTRPLPVDVSVTYTLNGRDVRPRDVVGKSGTLAVTYHVRNVTAEPTEITYTDGRGVTRTKTVDLPTPYVGQLQTTLPARFGAIDAPRADIAGDGRGANLLTWTMVLFSPIGELDQTFGWTAHVTNGIAPKASVQIVPVPPKRKPELKYGEDGLSGGAAQATELTAGAGQIDGHVIELRDGASALLDGLTKLAAGATTLKTGLAGKAAPGALQLAGGADLAADGAVRIAGGLHAADDGTQQVLGGSQDLAAGAGLVSTGARQVSDGIGQVGDGLTQLATSVSGLATNPGYLALKAGIAAISAGLGSAASPLTILGALNAVELGLNHPAGALGPSDPGGLKQGLTSVSGGVGILKAGLTNAKTAVATMAAAVAQQQALLADALVQGACAATPGIPLCVDIATANGIAAAVADGLTNPDPALGLGAGVDAALAGIGSAATPGATILYGLAAAIAGIGSPSVPGQTLLYGLHQAILGLDHPTGAAGPADPGGVKQGVSAVGAGVDLLVSGIIDAVNGALGTPSTSPATTLRGAVAALGTGAGQVADGAQQVADGSGALSLGTLSLADGVRQLDNGAGDLVDGIDRLKAGAHDLASGIGDAADGSVLIAGGLGDAKAGTGKLHAGAGRLSTEGTKVLEAKGNTTAADSALSYATLAKLDEKAASGGLPYGAPAGGTGSAAYMLTLAAADTHGTEDAGRAALALGLLVVASAAGALVRRRFSAAG